MYPIKSSGLCFSAFSKCTKNPCKYTSYMHLCMKIHYKFLTYLCGLHFSYGREISSLTLKAEHALRVHDKIVFSWIYVHNWQDVKKEGKNYILRTFYIFPVYSPCCCASALSSAIYEPPKCNRYTQYRAFVTLYFFPLWSSECLSLKQIYSLTLCMYFLHYIMFCGNIRGTLLKQRHSIPPHTHSWHYFAH